MSTEIEKYNYSLPRDSIAQRPVEPRSSARLLDGTQGPQSIVDRTVADLPSLLGPGDLVVVNDTRVIPARLNLLRRSGGVVEVLLVDRIGDSQWEALVKPSSRVGVGERLLHRDVEVAVVHERLSESGTRRVELLDPSFIDRSGKIPYPPYIESEPEDSERYQTVYANRPGSVAAPTAGLHLDRATLAGIERSGAELVKIDLRVGIGTFLPIKVEMLDKHEMHSESYRIEPDVWRRITSARRVVAIGTTVVRAVESAAATGVLEGRTTLFIRDSYDFKEIDVLLTNFHVPKSTLLVMIASFYGEGWRSLYDHALVAGYRFLSFGDAMLISRAAGKAAPVEG